MRVGIIGLGRVGTALACALADRGYQILACSRKASSKESLELEGRSLPVVTLRQLAQKADLIFITTPDSAIAETAGFLQQKRLQAQGVVHMSGSQSSEVLSPLRQEGCWIGSLHPLQSFAGIKEAVSGLPGSCFTYEGDSELTDLLKPLVADLGGCFQILPSPESKSIYHAGACLVSNYLVLLAELGVQCLEQAGFNRAKGQEVLLPLMRSTLDNLASLPLERALTGPVVRGDLGVVSAHLTTLQTQLPDVFQAYRGLTPLLGKLAMRSGSLNSEQYKRLVEILEEDNKHG